MNSRPRPTIILIDIHDLLVARTGIRTYIQELMAALQEREDRSVSVKVVPSKEFVEKIDLFRRSRGVFISILFHAYTFIWKQFLLPVYAWFCRASHLICPDYLAPMWRLRCRKIVVFHDTFFWESPDDYNKYWLRYFKWVVKLGLRGNTRILTVSKTSQKKLQNLAFTDTPVSYIHTSYHTRLPQSNGSVHSVPYFLHVGVLEKRKNLPMLIEAYATARKEQDNMPDLIFIGQRGPKKDLDDSGTIFNYIQSYELEQSIHWVDYVDEQLLSNYYSGALAYVFPSKNEGFGLPILEAFSFNTPVIISNQEALMEISNGAAYVVSPSEKKGWSEILKKVADQEKFRQSLISKGKLRLGHFNRSTFAKKVLEEISA